MSLVAIFCVDEHWLTLFPAVIPTGSSSKVPCTTDATSVSPFPPLSCEAKVIKSSSTGASDF